MVDVVGVEFQVSVTPVQAHSSSTAKRSQLSETRARPAVPRRAHFNDSDVPFGDVGFNLDLIPEMFGDAGIAPAAYTDNVSRDSHCLNTTATI